MSLFNISLKLGKQYHNHTSELINILLYVRPTYVTQVSYKILSEYNKSQFLGTLIFKLYHIFSNIYFSRINNDILLSRIV